MEWLSSTASWASLIGLPVTVAGLIYAVIQVSRTKTAADASRDAAQATLRQARVESLLAAVDRLRSVYSLLQAAALDNAPQVSAQLLDQWCWGAAGARVLVLKIVSNPKRGTPTSTDTTLYNLQMPVSLARVAAGLLDVQGAHRPRVGHSLQWMGRALDGFAELVPELQVAVEEGSHEHRSNER